MTFSWGKLIRELRVKRRLSVKNLAKKTGLSESGLRKLEAGVSSQTQIGTIECLLDALQHDLDAIQRQPAVTRSPAKQRTGGYQSTLPSSAATGMPRTKCDLHGQHGELP
jgi:transcriptional regulator with XRE-family HTH domain